MTTCHYINSGQSNFEYEYLGEFENQFKNILGHESGAQVCSFDGKKQRSKISCYCPFNFAKVGSKKFEAKKNIYFSRERAKRMRNGSRFASFRFEAKNFFLRNRRTLATTPLPPTTFRPTAFRLTFV
jgi:hypothetical protein